MKFPVNLGLKENTFQGGSFCYVNPTRVCMELSN